MNGNLKIISEAAKHPLVAVILITMALLYIVQGVIESQDSRLDRQVELMGEISETLIHIQNGQDDLVDNNNDFLDGLVDQAIILKDLVWQIKQINGN